MSTKKKECSGTTLAWPQHGAAGRTHPAALIAPSLVVWGAPISHTEREVSEESSSTPVKLKTQLILD